MFEFSRIKKECFWDSNITEEMFQNIILSQDMGKKQYVFEKILLNSTKMLKDLTVFQKKDLKKLLDNLKISNFNKEYILRRKNLAEVYFFDKELQIDELKWVA